MQFIKNFNKIFKQSYKGLLVASGLSLAYQEQNKSVLNESKILEFTIQSDNSMLFEANTIDNDQTEFKNQIIQLIQNGQKEGRKCAWLKLNSEQFHHLEFLIKEQGFKIHHALKGYVMLTKWLDESQQEFYMPYATHNGGSGGVVINEKNEILLVKEKKGIRNKFWGFPGGRVDLGEAMHEAALREVREETGLQCQPKDLLLYRDMSRAAYGQPDLYFLYILKPLTNDVNICKDELADYTWVPLSDLDNFIEQQEMIVPLQKYAFQKLSQLYKEGYRFNDEKRVQEFFTVYNNSNYNIYMPTRGYL